MSKREIPPSAEMLSMTLRKYRTDAGLTMKELAGKISYTTSLVGMTETGARFPSLDYIRRLDPALDADGWLIELQRTAARDGAIGPLAALADYEATATSICLYNPIRVPGLLQTEGYATAVISGGLFAAMTSQEASLKVAARLQRQDVVHKPSPPEVWVVLNEAVLLQVVDSAEVMKEQVERLLSLIRTQPNVRIQVLPLAESAHAPSAPMAVLEVPGVGHVAYLDAPDGGRTTTDPRTVKRCRDWFDVLQSQAASLTESARLIEKRLERL